MTELRNALVVDDHPTNRLLASALLKKMGWTVMEAESGNTALTLAAEQPFRLVLLDISMPGEETCAGLRSIAASPPLHIIAYTAHAFPEDLERLLGAGFDEVLVKPINRQRLEEMVSKL